MKKYTLIIFILLSLILLSIFLSYKLFFQNADDIKSIFATKDFTKFENFIKKKSKEDNIQGHWKYLRDVTHEFKEGVFVFDQFDKDENGNNSNSYDIFQVKLIISGNEIIYYEFNQQKNKKVKYSWSDSYSWEPYFVLIEKFINEKKFNELKISFENIYNSKLNTKELFQTDYIYGESCGVAGMIPNERCHLNNFVNRKDKMSILKWLKSTNTEKQIYAVEGLLKLKKNGINLNKEELEIIQYILNKKGNIRVCHGCVHTSSKIYELKKELII